MIMTGGNETREWSRRRDTAFSRDAGGGVITRFSGNGGDIVKMGNGDLNATKRVWVQIQSPESQKKYWTNPRGDRESSHESVRNRGSTESRRDDSSRIPRY